MTTSQDVAVTYTGTDNPFKDRIYRSGLTFTPGQTRLVPATLAQRFLRHTDVFTGGAAEDALKTEPEQAQDDAGGAHHLAQPDGGDAVGGDAAAQALWQAPKPQHNGRQRDVKIIERRADPIQHRGVARMVFGPWLHQRTSRNMRSAAQRVAPKPIAAEPTGISSGKSQPQP